MKYTGPVQFVLLHDDTPEAIDRGRALTDYGRILLARAAANVGPDAGYNAITHTLPDGSEVKAELIGPDGHGAVRQHKVTIRTRHPGGGGKDEPRPFLWVGVEFDWENTDYGRTSGDEVHPSYLNMEVYEPDFEGYVTCWPWLESYPPYIQEPDLWWDQTYNGCPGVGIFYHDYSITPHDIGENTSLRNPVPRDDPDPRGYPWGRDYTIAYSKRFLYLNHADCYPAYNPLSKDNDAFKPYDPQRVRPAINWDDWDAGKRDGIFLCATLDPYQGMNLVPYDKRKAHIWEQDWKNKAIVGVDDYGGLSRLVSGNYVVKLSWYRAPCAMRPDDKVAFKIHVVLNKEPHTVRKTFRAQINGGANHPRFSFGWGINITNPSAFNCPWESGLTPNGPSWWQDELLINVRAGTASLASKADEKVVLPVMNKDEWLDYGELSGCGGGYQLWSIDAEAPYASADEGDMARALAEIVVTIRAAFYGSMSPDGTMIKPLGTVEEETETIRQALLLHAGANTYGWWIYNPFVGTVSADMWTPGSVLGLGAFPPKPWNYYVDDVLAALKTYAGVVDGSRPGLTSVFYDHGRSGGYLVKYSVVPDC